MPAKEVLRFLCTFPIRMAANPQKVACCCIERARHEDWHRIKRMVTLLVRRATGLMFSWLSGALRRGGSDSAAREQPATGVIPAPSPATQAAAGRPGPGPGLQQGASGIDRPAQPQLGGALHAPDSQAADSKVAQQPASRPPSSATPAGSGRGQTARAARVNGGRGRGRPKGSSLASSPGRSAASKRLASEVSAPAAPAVGGKRVRKPPALLMHEPPGPQLGTPAVRLPKPSTTRVPVTVAADRAQPAPEAAGASRDAARQRTASPKAPLPAASDRADAARGRKTRGSTAAKMAGSEGTATSRKRLASQEQQRQPQQQHQQQELEQEQEQLEGAMPIASATVSVPAAGSTARTGAQEQLQVLQPPLELVLPLTLLPPRPKRQRQPPDRLMNHSEGRQLASAEDRAAEAARRRAARPFSRRGGESVSTAPSGPSAAAATAGVVARPAAAPGAAASLLGGASAFASSSSEADTPSLVLVNKAPTSPESPEHATAAAESRLRPLSTAEATPAGQSLAMAAPQACSPCAMPARPPELPRQASAASMQQGPDHHVGESLDLRASDGFGSAWPHLQPGASIGPMTAATAAQEIDPILSRAAALLPAGGWQTVPVTSNPFISTVRAFLEDPCIPDASEHLMQPRLPLPGVDAAGHAGAGLPLTVPLAPGRTTPGRCAVPPPCCHFGHIECQGWLHSLASAHCNWGLVCLQEGRSS